MTQEAKLKLLSEVTTLWGVLLACILGVTYLLYLNAVQEKILQSSQEQRLIVTQASDTLINRLSMVQKDLEFLRLLFESGDVIDFRDQQIQSTIKQFMQSHLDAYTQARFIDSNGMEKIRIDNVKNSKTVVFNETELQDKSQRYYFYDTIILPSRSLYISPLDLNIEHGQVEIPFNPTIRFAVPVDDRRGNRLGVVVLNYSGKGLLDLIRNINFDYNHELWLNDDNGYWLIAADPALEWGFMFENRKDINLPSLYPEIWRQISRYGENGIITKQIDDSLITHTSIELHTSIGKDFLIHEQEYLLHISSFLPKRNMQQLQIDLQKKFILPLVILSISSLLLSIWIARLRESRRRHSEQIVQLEINQKARQHFQTIVESSPAALLAVDKNQNIQLANAKAEEIFAYKKHSMIDMPLEKLIPERFRSSHHHNVIAFQQNPTNRSMGIGRDLYGLTHDGREIPIEVGLSSTVFNNENLILVAVLDISQRKFLESQLDETLNRLNMAIQIAGIGIWRWTLENNYLEWDDRAYEIFNIDAQTPLTLDTWRQCIHPDDLNIFDQDMTQVNMSSTGFTHEYRICINDEIRWLKISAMIEKGNNHQPRALTGIILDYTEARTLLERTQNLNNELERRVANRTADLQTANNDLNAFAYSVSHDLRAPLRAMDGFSQLLQQKYANQLDETANDYLNRIQNASQKMGQIIDDLLMLSRVSRSQVERHNINISNLIQQTFDKLQEQDPDRVVELEIEANLMANADSALLNIIIDNLLRNAWKFTSKTEHAKISFGQCLHQGKMMFYIKDNGAGFDMDFADKLFMPFQRLHVASDFPGTGIGLATVHRGITKHGGSIDANGEVDKGAIFYFTFDDK